MQRDHQSDATSLLSSVSEHAAGSLKEAALKRRPGGRSTKVQMAVFGATMELLLTKGYDAVTMAEVASRSHIHETSLYRRWKTREALVTAVLIQRMQEVLPMPDTGSVQSDLVRLLRTVMTFLQSPLGKAMIQASAISLHNAAMVSERLRYWGSRFDQFNRIVERAIERGELPPQTDGPLLLKTLIGPLYVQVFLLNQPSDEGLPERIVNLVLAGAKHAEKQKR